jgi:hypothetical protein
MDLEDCNADILCNTKYAQLPAHGKLFPASPLPHRLKQRPAACLRVVGARDRMVGVKTLAGFSERFLVLCVMPPLAHRLCAPTIDRLLARFAAFYRPNCAPGGGCVGHAARRCTAGAAAGSHGG